MNRERKLPNPSLLLLLAVAAVTALYPGLAVAQSVPSQWTNLGNLNSQEVLEFNPDCDYRIKTEESSWIGSSWKRYYLLTTRTNPDFSLSGEIGLQHANSLGLLAIGRATLGASQLIHATEVFAPYQRSIPSEPEVLPLGASIEVNKKGFIYFDNSEATKVVLVVNAKHKRYDESVMFQDLYFPLDGNRIELEEKCQLPSTGDDERFAQLSQLVNETARKLGIIINKLHLPSRWFR